MSFDPRDELWNASYETWYSAAYNEVLAERLLRRWQVSDDVSKVLIAATTSGSVIAGWALWTQAGFVFVWGLLAGAGALLAIVSSALGVPSRLKDWGEIRRTFGRLQVDLETFRYRMQINPEFELDGFTSEFVGYRTRLGEATQLIKDDILATNGLKGGCQDVLNQRLGQREQT